MTAKVSRVSVQLKSAVVGWFAARAEECSRCHGCDAKVRPWDETCHNCGQRVIEHHMDQQGVSVEMLSFRRQLTAISADPAAVFVLPEMTRLEAPVQLVRVLEELHGHRRHRHEEYGSDLQVRG